MSTIQRTLKGMLRKRERLSKQQALQLREMILADGFVSKSERKILHHAMEDDLFDQDSYEIIQALCNQEVDSKPVNRFR